ncbi:MAG: AAA family ATPase [Bryobacterales bacterium]|nr:AAA family ATPase [Bryobacterales bacterium]
MNLLPCALPSPPSWQVDWPDLNARFDWIRAMRDCPQDPVHHAEGDVWIHVRSVCQAMAELPEWRALPDPDRELLFAAALLHDVAKPCCTRVEHGRISARGHSHRGSIMARRILWEHGAPLPLREHVCALVRHHQVPFFLLEREDALRLALRISQSARCSLLALLARADALGRRCADSARLLEKIALFSEFCREQHCLDRPWAFPSELARYEYFRSENRDPHYAPHSAPPCEVTLMSGLPGAGKDTWIASHAPGLPVISLDLLREELAAAPTGAQGDVVQAARERARQMLRAKQSFVWNATNLTRDMRLRLIELFGAYGARVRIVYVEAPSAALFSRLRQRERSVPIAAIDRMMDRWEIPELTEAPLVEWWQNAGQWTRTDPALP